MITQIDRGEMLRYLGYRGQELSPALEARIGAAADTCLRLAKPRFVSRIFDIERQDGEYFFSGSAFRVGGETAEAYLRGCSKAALMALTIGAGIDAEISRLTRTDITLGVLLDAAASTMTEQFCDEIAHEIRASAHGEGLTVTPRFSPGYGDLPLNCQPALLGVLDAGRRIGLSCTPDMIMLPRKSVSAIIGLTTERRPETGPCRGGCPSCNLRESCPYQSKKDGL